MIPCIKELAERDVTWLAIRYPAVMRLLYRELAAPDGDAHAAGLELATRVLGTPAPRCDVRLDHAMLNAGMVAVRGGRCDRAIVRSIREQIDALPVALTPREQDAVATVVAAIICAIVDASSREPREHDDALVA